MSGETIEGAAIRHAGKIYSLPRPARHHDVIARVRGLGLGGPVSAHAQGFVTDRGRFVDRREACTIARLAGQIVEKHGPRDVLFSEDVW